MRSSKSRSRNKSNRNRTSSVGNVVNRVFDSSGPEGKVRGTPQQIIEKYNQLARDAQLSNDRVATENFQQHAEHYLRLLGEAQKEMDAKRDQQERENRDRQADRDRDRPQQQHQPQQHQQHQRGEEGNDPGNSPQPDISDANGDGDGESSALVDTPESKSPPKRAPRKPRQKPAPEGDVAAQQAGDGNDGDSAQEAVQPRPKRTRKPKADAGQADAQNGAKTDDGTPPSEAAAE
ncbi:DUF4167 domain-containing protein [Roseovarius sp. Pro17]|uniref:DUF4167 domain-containing protein n=1 Tax=Roseovarius sp. Pro17 TaxID=3108175 RepID=UPI002D7A33CA|nr:DUF4167 domain-containing protein [Roseovarius sp. Pro17]